MKKQDATKWAITIVIVAAGFILIWWSSQPRVQVIDGCEYIVTTHGYNSSIVHKANCRNHKQVMP